MNSWSILTSITVYRPQLPDLAKNPTPHWQLPRTQREFCWPHTKPLPHAAPTLPTTAALATMEQHRKQRKKCLYCNSSAGGSKTNIRNLGLKFQFTSNHNGLHQCCGGVIFEREMVSEVKCGPTGLHGAWSHWKYGPSNQYIIAFVGCEI